MKTTVKDTYLLEKLAQHEFTSAPSHLQLKELLETHIEQTLRLGDKLPSERQMATSAGINRATMTKAINSLVCNGTLRRIHGKGTFLASKNKTGYLNYYRENHKLKKEYRIKIALNLDEEILSRYKILEYNLLEALDELFDTVQGNALEIVNVAPYSNNEQKCLKAILEDSPDGIIFISNHRSRPLNQALLEALSRNNVATVCINDLYDISAIDYAIFGHAKCMELAIGYLKQLNHTNITLVTAGDDIEWMKIRRNAFNERIEASPDLTGNTIFTPSLPKSLPRPDDYRQMGYEAGLAYLPQKKCSAIIGLNDGIAAGICQASKELGIAIPEQLSVVGIENYYGFRLFNLSTITYSAKEMAKNALGILLLRLDGNDTVCPERKIEISPDFIERQTTMKRQKGCSND